jgi:uncharacterized membrane protein
MDLERMKKENKKLNFIRKATDKSRHFAIIEFNICSIIYLFFWVNYGPP